MACSCPEAPLSHLARDVGGAWTLPRIVGSARACELYLPPRRITESLNDAEDISFTEALIGEAEGHVRTGVTEDAREAGAAVREKRTHVFKRH